MINPLFITHLKLATQHKTIELPCRINDIELLSPCGGFQPAPQPPTPECRADQTVNNIGKALRALAKHCNLARYKKNLCSSYDHYVKIHGLTWKKPIYFRRARMPKISLEGKIDCIIANASEKLARAIAMSKDTGLRSVELMNLKTA